jgi:hypothetical protein
MCQHGKRTVAAALDFSVKTGLYCIVDLFLDVAPTMSISSIAVLDEDCQRLISLSMEM